MDDPTSAVPVGVIGGSGLYAIEGIENPREIAVDTPFGPPSDTFVAGTFAGRTVYFLPRHGRGHRIAPHELPHRANLWALRSLGVRYVICVTAVGSLQAAYPPRSIVLPSQFLDRTTFRAEHTFFGEGIVAHISLADPVSAGLQSILFEEAASLGFPVHRGGTYVNMDGPGFSTRAESEAYRHLGCDVIGMTNFPEAKLARESEIALATLAMVTDYDCWKTDEEPVSTATVIGHVQANAAAAQRILPGAIARIPPGAGWPEHRSLANAFLTRRELWPEATVAKLRPVLAPYLA